jgi:ketosteroid isomerase-like protein
MTENRRTVNEYMDGFRKTDYERSLSCLTEDVEWEIPGAYEAYGRDAQPLSRWKATSVYRRENEQWLIVHAHWSLVKRGEAAAP